MNGPGKKAGALAKAPLTFLLVMSGLLLALGWLGWLLLDQDRSLQHERTRDRVDAAAQNLSDALKLQADVTFEELTGLATSLGSLADDKKRVLLQKQERPGLTVHFSGLEMIAEPISDIYYLPLLPRPDSVSLAFESADRLEFRQGSLDEALKLLDALSRSPDRALQAGAHLRLGRISNRSGDVDRAVEEYARLEEFDDQYIENVPAQWLAHYARCRIFVSENNRSSFESELAILSSLLLAGGSEVSQATYRFYAEAVNAWQNSFDSASTAMRLPLSHGLSEAVGELHFIWTELMQGRGSTDGIRIYGQGQGSLLKMWVFRDSMLLGKVLDFNELHRHGLLQLTENLQTEGLGWSISNAQGQQILSSVDEPVSEASIFNLAIGDSSLIIQVFETATLVPMPEDIRRRQFLLAGLAVILVVILMSTYFILRALRREAETAELQADFVAAVSHEFRTPLTSIRQLLELLASGRINDQEKIADYYRILDKESARLQRMVEDLLDFRRMESDAKPYRLESLDVAGLLKELTHQFREEYGLNESSLKLEAMENHRVQMDRESLVRAIWNLLDNAVKYSEGDPQITVSTRQTGNKLAISVADKGIGIAREEQSRVFRKFVRGSTAKVSQVKGTGLGLAMVRKILEDQGANIKLESEIGAGSTFTIEIEAEGVT